MKKLRKLKKGLAMLLTATMVVGLMPGVGTLQVSATESDENTVNTVSSNEAMTPEPTPEQTVGQTTNKLITAWQWIDEEEYLDEETGSLALPGASEQRTAYFDDVTAFLPTRIQATVVNADDSENSETGAEETIPLGDWSCDNFPEEGAYSGSYTFTATLPEGYALSEEAEELTITVELGGAQMYDDSEYVNGFCQTYNATTGNCSNTNHTDCSGYQPAVETTDKYDINNDGIKDTVYEISNAGQLYWFAGLVNGTLSGVDRDIYANAVLTADITVNTGVLDENGDLNTGAFRSWTPIGGYYTTTVKYIGIFDGNNNTISGLYYDESSESISENYVYVGLFGLNSGTIKNVGIVDSYFGLDSGSSGYEFWVGGLCGVNDSTIENCDNEATVTVKGTGNTNASVFVGGVCGNNSTDSLNSTGIIKNCKNAGKVSSTVSTGRSLSVGGVCGYNCYGDTIENCYNEGKVNGTKNVGGVCGFNYAGDGGTATITNCYNTNTVSGTDYVGGVCGYNDTGDVGDVGTATITNCYNTNIVSGTKNVGGVCGYNDAGDGGTATITNCYNTNIVSGTNYVGGVCGYNNARAGGTATITNCYNINTVSGTRYAKGVCGGKSSSSGTATITNCYYLDTTVSDRNATPKTATQFANGEVAYLLSKGCTVGETTYDGSVWGQKLGDNGDAYPVLKKEWDEGNTVYTFICGGNNAYTNDSALSGITQGHDFSEQRICSNCNHEFSKSDLTAYVSSLSEVAEANYSDATVAVYRDAKTEAENLAGETADASAADLYWAYCELKSAYEALKPVALIVGTVANPSDTGKQTGGGKYAVGETVTLTAEGVNGWTFNGWYKDEKLVSDKAEVTFTVTEDMSGTVSYTAKYTHVSHTMDEDSHICSVCGTSYYKVTFDYGNSTTEEVYTTGNVEFPAGDYIFKVGDDVIDTSDYTVSENTTITVESLAEAGKYAVTITGDAHCTLTVTDSNGNTVVNGDEVAAGTILKVSVKVDDGYTLTKTPESSYTVSEATTIKAVTEAKTYEVTVDDTYYKSGEAGAPTASVEDLFAVPYGTSLTLTAADANSGYEFLGWYQTNGKQLTAEKVYTVTITSALTVQPRYQQNSGTVTFVANGRVIDTIENATESTAIVFPSNVDAYVGFEFAGWDKTEEQIHSALASGENVIVTALFERVKANYVVTIYNAEETNAETMTITESKYISVTAKDVAGKNFAYWMLDGEIQSYNKTISFFVTDSCTLKAVYSVEATQALGTALIKSGSYDISTHKLTVLGYMTVPSDGCKIVSAGLYAASANSDKYNANDELTSANADYVKSSAKAVGTAGPLSYTWTKTNVNAGDIWYVRPYIIYTDEENEEHTVYGDRVTLCAGTEYDPAEKATAKIDGISYDSTSLKAKFVVYLAVPENAVIQKAGLVAKSQAAGFNPDTEILSANNAQYVKSSTLAVGTNGPLTYTWTKTNVNIGDIWYVRAYLVYIDKDGIEHTVYGDLLKYTAQ